MGRGVGTSVGKPEGPGVGARVGVLVVVRAAVGLCEVTASGASVGDLDGEEVGIA